MSDYAGLDRTKKNRAGEWGKGPGIRTYPQLEEPKYSLEKKDGRNVATREEGWVYDS